MSNQEECEDDEIRIFVSDTSGPEGYIGFFEDDGETGCLYVSDRRNRKIVQHLQIYNKSIQLRVQETDIGVIWSRDGSKCAVRIWGCMRGIIDLGNKREGRAFIESRDTKPIDASDWLEGFDE